jgi:hypothetical protein
VARVRRVQSRGTLVAELWFMRYGEGSGFLFSFSVGWWMRVLRRGLESVLWKVMFEVLVGWKM